MHHYDTMVIGGGASGMMAALVASQQGKRSVLLVEKNNTLGTKLNISGGGRCNITHAEYDLRKLLTHYGEQGKFLFSTFSQFGVREAENFFTHNGLPLVVQERQRVFPRSEKASDVVLLFKKLLTEYGVTLSLSNPVQNIIIHDHRITHVVTQKGSYTADHIILATGGVSHPETGSTGDGFRWLRDMGHTVIQPTPSIVPLRVRDAWIKKLSGKSFDDVQISFFVDGQKKISKQGRVLATHFGISGPLILNSAHQVHDLLHTGTVTASLNLFPRQDAGAVDRLLVRMFNEHSNKTFKNVFELCVPQGMSEVIRTCFFDEDIDPQIKVHSITQAMRKQMVHQLMNLPMTITGLMGFDRAVIADGGVPLSEIDTKTMRSLKVHNLAITGDLLHIQRPSGGFSLQLCWTTGYVAGVHSE